LTSRTTQTCSDDQKFSHRPRSAFWLRATSAWRLAIVHAAAIASLPVVLVSLVPGSLFAAPSSPPRSSPSPRSSCRSRLCGPARAAEERSGSPAVRAAARVSSGGQGIASRQPPDQFAEQSCTAELGVTPPPG